MEISIDTVMERDIDLLILEEFISDKGFAQIFTDTINLKGKYNISNVFHSKVDSEYGESDIVFVLDFDRVKHAIYIEDKINAIAMPEQNNRYHLRAKKETENGEYDEYSVVIVAPKKYLDNNSEAKKYKHKVTYEKLLEYLRSKENPRYLYKALLVQRAIDGQGSGYQWKANQDVVRFCSDMYAYQSENFPGMIKGTVAWWPRFKTIHKNIEVVLKANKGHCDLAFIKLSYPELYNKYKDKILGKMAIVEAGKSSAIRIEVTPIKFEDDFEAVKKDVHEALAVIKELLEFGNSLDV